MPASCSFRMAMICSSVCLLRFIVWSFLKARLQFTLDQFKGATSFSLEENETRLDTEFSDYFDFRDPAIKRWFVTGIFISIAARQKSGSWTISFRFQRTSSIKSVEKHRIFPLTNEPMFAKQPRGGAACCRLSLAELERQYVQKRLRRNGASPVS